MKRKIKVKEKNAKMWGGLGKKKEKENKKRVQLGREVGEGEGIREGSLGM